MAAEVQKVKVSQGSVVCISLLFGYTLSCFDCFIDKKLRDVLCEKYVIEKNGINSPPECYRLVKKIFRNQSLLQAARVSKDYHTALGEKLIQLIKPISLFVSKNWTNDSVYDQILRTAADRFVVEVSNLPRVACYPPCGSQGDGFAYDCAKCSYESCDFDLDCPVIEIKVIERSRIRMPCKVPFDLPNEFMAVWRFAEIFNTRELEKFTEVTAGVDMVFSIPSTTSQNQGTYQCEIFSNGLSIVRLYYYVSVIPMGEIGHTELQEIFELSTFGSLNSSLDPSSQGPSAVVLIACVSAVLLVLLLTLVVLDIKM
ncbi:sperm acrosome membrane-associated protein 6 [Eucyclogobius newberryi]|uniref:sperm acrosome membrane-associated protein 6 n=1 Tax=Eucyclogobius newberryi TaxID=166745 RepID=UPI003B5C083B